MSLITKTVKVKWNGRNKKYYINKGYKFTKIGDEFEVKVEDLPKGSHMEVKCVCDGCGCELNWKYQNYNRCVKDNGKTYCQKCSRICSNDKRNNTLLKSSKSFKEWCIENDKQDVLNRWDYELNNCLPSEISYGTHKKYWFKCDKHIKHKSELKNIKSFTSGHNGVMDCKQCNSIAQWFLNNNLKLENYWDYNKNAINPWEISCSSDKKVWIKCQEKDYHESYEIACSDFIDGCRCPYCNHNSGKIHPKDSLGQYIIDNYNEDVLNKIWSKKNKKSPFEYTPYSNYKVWWKCLNGKHEDYKRGCYSSLKYNFRCPQCSKERTESFGEEKTRLYLESLGYNILHEHNCTIRPINPKTKMPLPYDNEIILDNGEHLIIEVHGEQHYRSKNIWTDKDKTPKQQLHYQQVKDRYKRIYAIQNGYSYLEIPYNTIFDKQETYKKLIDDKIKQIKNETKESA